MSSDAYCLGDRITCELILLQVLLGKNLRGHSNKRSALYGHELASPITGLASLVIEPSNLLRVWHLKLWRPAGDVDLHALRVFVVPEQGLEVFPAVQCANFAKFGVDDDLQRFSLAFSPDRSLYVGRLDLASVMDDLALWGDERLRHVETSSITLAIPQNNHHTSLLDSLLDASHLGRIPAHRIGHVLMNPPSVVDDGRCPHLPA